MSQDESDHGRNDDRSFWDKACVEFSRRFTPDKPGRTDRKVYDIEDRVQDTIYRALFYSRNPEEIRDAQHYLSRMMHRVKIDNAKKYNESKIEDVDTLQSKDVRKNPHLAVESDIPRIWKNKELLQELSNKQGDLTEREQLLLKLHLEGNNCEDIAEMLKEDVSRTKADWNALKAKLRYRLKEKAKTKGSGKQ
jgi:DNA-directed RNA polymerase specialized sigma24 family protein